MLRMEVQKEDITTLDCWGCGEPQFFSDVASKKDDKYVCNTCHAVWGKDGLSRLCLLTKGAKTVRFRVPYDRYHRAVSIPKKNAMELQMVTA